MISRPKDLESRLAALARVGAATTPVVSVYLGTQWRDEHQRGRVRAFIKKELSEARRAGKADEEDLGWIDAEVTALVEQALFPDALGAALFACRGLGLREMLPLAVPVEDAFVVADTPHLRPLAALAEEYPSALVVQVDARSARLVPVSPLGAGEIISLRTDEVPGHHARGGWALLAQSRYGRHIQEHRARHFEAVAHAVTDVVRKAAVERIVIAGEPRAIAVFRQELPADIDRLVVGAVSGAAYDTPSGLVDRTRALLQLVEGASDSAEVDGLVTEAAKGGSAAAGLEASLEALGRGAVHRLYLVKDFRAPGRRCVACGALAPGAEGPCRICGERTEPAELGEAMVERALATAAEVTFVERHAELAAREGVAVRLRYR